MFSRAFPRHRISRHATSTLETTTSIKTFHSIGKAQSQPINNKRPAFATFRPSTIRFDYVQENLTTLSLPTRHALMTFTLQLNFNYRFEIAVRNHFLIRHRPNSQIQSLPMLQPQSVEQIEIQIEPEKMNSIQIKFHLNSNPGFFNTTVKSVFNQNEFQSN